MIKRGDKFSDKLGEVHVMAAVDGWAMVRRPGCAPLTIPIKQLKRWRKIDRVTA